MRAQNFPETIRLPHQDTGYRETITLIRSPCVKWESKSVPTPMTLSGYPKNEVDFDAPDLAIKFQKEIPNGIHPGADITTGNNLAAIEAAYKKC